MVKGCTATPSFLSEPLQCCCYQSLSMSHRTWSLKTSLRARVPPEPIRPLVQPLDQVNHHRGRQGPPLPPLGVRRREESAGPGKALPMTALGPGRWHLEARPCCGCPGSSSFRTDTAEAELLGRPRAPQATRILQSASASITHLTPLSSLLSK